MTRVNRLSLALAVLLAGGGSMACGPDFPNELLANRDATLRHLPEGAFEYEIRRLLPAPDASWVPSESQDYFSSAESLAEERQRAEAELLDAGQQALVVRMRAAGSAQAAYAAGDGLAEPIRRYTAGAVAWQQGEFDTAAHYFDLALEQDQEPNSWVAVWSQYMLARHFAMSGDAVGTVTGFFAVRERVSAGAADPLGLAVASLGEEAAFVRAREPLRALQLYVTQAATGSPSGLNSTLFLVREAFADPELLQNYVDDPLGRRVAIAYAYSRASELAVDDPELVDEESDMVDPYRIGAAGAIARLLDAIDASATAGGEGLDRLAAVAYRAGRFEMAERLLGEPKTPLAHWVKAKLALRQGDREAAARAYAAAAEAFPKDESWGGQYGISGNWEPLKPHCQVEAERGTLALARGEYLAAAEALFAAGDTYYTDLQYVAERVLNIDELRSFVDRVSQAAAGQTRLAQPEDEDDYGSWTHSGPSALRALLARRLMRLGQYDAALHYFDSEEHREAATRYVDALRRAQRSGFGIDPVAQAEAWFEAAQIARYDGMEILGMEGQPDFNIWGGNFGNEPGHFDEEWNWIAEPPVDIKLAGDFIGSDEPARLEASRPAYLSRFHYRQIAADHAMQAANFVPARSQAFAAMLCEGTRWLIDRQPEAAQVLYRRYVAEGALVPFGTTFGGTCPAPEFDRARERLKFERIRSAKIAIRHYGPYGAAAGLLLLAAWWWRRRRRAA